MHEHTHKYPYKEKFVGELYLIRTVQKQNSKPFSPIWHNLKNKERIEDDIKKA